MPYRLRKKKSVEKSIHKIAREQIDRAIGEIDDEQLDRHDTVHQVRKRCKKIRGLIRLVRPRFEATYQRENAWYRDAAERLSYVRDAQSIIETLDELDQHFQEQIARDTFSQIRQPLTERRREVAEDQVGLRERLETCRQRMCEGRERVAAWQLDADEFDAVAPGLSKTYKRARGAMKQAYKHPCTECFHEWRKRAKYHWYHLRLLRPIWSDPVKARRDEADLLSDYLGDDHDLSILRETLLAAPEQFGGNDTVQTAIGLMDRRQVELRTKAKALGERLFAEKPKQLLRRFGAYWTVWRRETRREPQVVHKPELVTS